MKHFKQYKLRSLTKNNKTGDAIGVGLPNFAIHQFSGTYFTVEVEETRIILESGCKLTALERKKRYEEQLRV